MKVYLIQTAAYNEVAFIEGEQAKVTDTASTGRFDGVDLYASDAAEQLRCYLATIELNSFDALPEDEIPASELDDADIKLTLIGEYE